MSTPVQHHAFTSYTNHLPFALILPTSYPLTHSSSPLSLIPSPTPLTHMCIPHPLTQTPHPYPLTHTPHPYLLNLTGSVTHSSTRSAAIVRYWWRTAGRVAKENSRRNNQSQEAGECMQGNVYPLRSVYGTREMKTHPEWLLWPSCGMLTAMNTIHYHRAVTGVTVPYMLDVGVGWI